MMEKVAAMEGRLAELDSQSSPAPALVEAYGLQTYGPDEAALKKMSDANSKLTDKSIKKVLDAGRNNFILI